MESVALHGGFFRWQKRADAVSALGRVPVGLRGGSEAVGWLERLMRVGPRAITESAAVIVAIALAGRLTACTQLTLWC